MISYLKWYIWPESDVLINHHVEENSHSLATQQSIIIVIQNTSIV